MQQITIGGFVPFSTVDYPGHISFVIFCQGCPLKCRYCYNTDLANLKTQGHFEWNNIYDFLGKRKLLLDSVVFSGGEPTVQKNLLEKIKSIKDLGFKVGIHTSGIYPKRLAKILPYVDWVGLDIKNIFTEYEQITGIRNSGLPVLKSLYLLLRSNINFECRTTIHKKFHNIDNLTELGNNLSGLGVKNYFLQVCRTANARDMSLGKQYISSKYKIKIQKILAPKFKKFGIRD